MKKLILLALSGVLLASLSGCGSAKAADADYIYGQIDSVSGNDIVLLLADYHENAESGDAGKEKTAEDSGSEKTKRQRPENGEMPEGFDPSQFGGKMPGGSSRSGGGDSEDSSSEKKRQRPENGEMPEGFDPSQFGGKMPGGSSRSGSGDSEDSGSEKKRQRPENGEMPEGFDPSQFGGEMPEGFDASEFSKRRSGSSKYTLTGEQEELRIPVGTSVTTAAGVETDFEALKPSDYIKCSIETDSDGQTVVTSVQIMEA
ncbi:MAG: hypothetical protein K6E36_07650 [Oscillospiraceae bacterium]|nr:hypothetical protein [Oscillospiraceae bacterium]